MSKYVPVGECPCCGAPILAEEGSWNDHAEVIEDQVYGVRYMSGIIYTCRCYQRAGYSTYPPVGVPTVWIDPQYYPYDNNYYEWVSPSIPRDTAGNPMT